MKTDIRGVPTSGADDLALLRYETALHQFQSYTGDPIAMIDGALAGAPAFVAGHMLKALVLGTLGEGQYLPAMRECIDRARAHLGDAGPRERALVAAAEKLAAGEWGRASLAFDHILRDWPRDALTLQAAHLVDFYRGDAKNLRDRIARVLPHWDESVPGYSYVLGMYAFGLEEMNQYAQAEETALRALSMQPKDGWAVHAAVHVMEMQGRIDEGIAFLTSREPDWAPDNGFAFHNFWHLALFHMDGGHFDRVLALYDAAIRPAPAQFILTLVDATALLWRLSLEGVDVGARFAAVADDWEARMDVEPGFYAFNDAHAAMAFIATGRHRLLEQLTMRMRDAASDRNDNAAMTREVGLPLVVGLTAFGRGRYAEAIRHLESVRDIAHRFGGSHAQRDLITLTLVEAALRAGDGRTARHYLAERLVHKRESAWAPRLVRRSHAMGELLRAA